MKLYLSSIGIKFPEEFHTLVGKSSGISTALIVNAFDYKSPEDRKARYQLIEEEFTKIGMELRTINLRDYKNKSAQLKSDLSLFDVIWTCGGNVFLLRQLLDESGLDGILRELLESGIVYGGDSAGAIVVGPSLEGFERADDINKANWVIRDGLGLVDFVVIPHDGNPKYQSALDEIKTELKNKQVPFEVINDSQAIIVNNGERKVIG